MENKIILLPQHIKTLESLPEQGMGYQLVDIGLKNGTKLQNRLVLNSTYLKLNDLESLDANDICDITLHED